MNEIILSNVNLPVPNNFASYSRAISQIPQINEEEEKFLVNLWQNEKNSDAAKKLILSHLYLVVKIVKNNAGYGLSEGDLAQEGTVGLMKAVHKFDLTKGVRLATYAWYWIEAEVREFILKNWRVVSWGTSSLAKKLFFGYRKTLSALQSVGEKRQIPSVSEIASSMDISEDDALIAQNYFLGKDVDIFMGEDQDEDDFKSKVVLSSEDSPEKNLILYQDQQNINKIYSCLEKLNDKQKEVIKGRFFQNPPMTLSNLSNKLDISIERVRQIESESILKLKKMLVK